MLLNDLLTLVSHSEDSSYQCKTFEVAHCVISAIFVQFNSSMSRTTLALVSKARLPDKLSVSIITVDDRKRAIVLVIVTSCSDEERGWSNFEEARQKVAIFRASITWRREVAVDFLGAVQYFYQRPVSVFNLGILKQLLTCVAVCKSHVPVSSAQCSMHFISDSIRIPLRRTS